VEKKHCHLSTTESAVGESRVFYGLHLPRERSSTKDVRQIMAENRRTQNINIYGYMAAPYKLTYLHLMMMAECKTDLGIMRIWLPFRRIECIDTFESITTSTLQFKKQQDEKENSRD
jgi:hypothetical protein